MAAYPLKRKGCCTLSYIKLYGFSCCRGFLIARLHTKVLWTKLNGEYALCGLLILIPEQADRLGGGGGGGGGGIPVFLS